MFRKGYNISFLGFFSYFIKLFRKIIYMHPKFISITIGYGIIFIWILYNALYHQKGRHPSPLLVTRNYQFDQIILGSIRSMMDPIKDDGMTFRLERVEYNDEKSSFKSSIISDNKISLLEEIQKELKKRDLYHGDCDGSFNDMTRKAIMSFQRIIDVTVDGIPNNYLLEILKKNSSQRNFFKLSSSEHESVILIPEYYYSNNLIADIITNSKISDFKDEQ
ncbi:peptidoglycan-binding domain-containing protein [Candidatus Liberibacter americanus]|uniref:Peptidoglycan binding-like domain-containing protein n=1 Tax=Candidatus Liberibacter americanus str. Sao Paulo TaxID=1261131 RepID=U6B8S8_9HYPH|nr:peptidoglycan-binding domain-containing protein [Candidatus Liberibacter americanus]AHA28157.1 hypothetical protein lam_816 [Candidatus Liberibacter americanus str. Sao Paulo]EMS35931.1 hypothetical protein G653_04087 [Candidatus Liberibacter americanus PW_SP]